MSKKVEWKDKTIVDSSAEQKNAKKRVFSSGTVEHVKFDPKKPVPLKDKTHPTKVKLGLTMIVKNEMKVLPRLFESVTPWIDYWVIHDTGSSDGTLDFIIEHFTKNNVPGELHHTPWKNFGFNRTKAVESTKDKVDFTLLLDADFILNVKDKNFKNALGRIKGHGHLIQYEGGMDYRQNLLVNSKLNWFYKGVTHEYIHALDSDPRKMIKFDGITITHKADGGNRSDKFERDIGLLEEALKEDETNGRYWFYLGQSYKDLGTTKKNLYDYKKRAIDEFKKKIANPGELTKTQVDKLKEKLAQMESELPAEDAWKEFIGKSIPAYYKRAEMGGWGEEVYYSYLQAGLARIRRGDTFWEILPDLLRAYMSRPTRLEALFHLVRYCRLNGMNQLGYSLGKMAENAKYPSDMLFIDRSIHELSFWDELSLCAHNVGDYKLAHQLGQRILAEKKYQPRDEPRIKRNTGWFKKIYDEKMVKEEANNLKGLNSAQADTIKKLMGQTAKSVTEQSKGLSGVGAETVPGVEKDQILAKKKETPGSFKFVRVRPEVKEGRLALIVTNYNMPERASAIAEYVKEHVKYPTDVILVDNGSDLEPPSKYTSLQLAQNVQTTHGWLMGLNYCDSLEVFEGFKYLAYGFVITSSEILEGQGDVIEKLMRPMVDDPEVAGVHPALSQDSTTWWKHLLKKGTGCRYTNMIDNIFSIYRADWFNQQGRFKPELTYAWGIDMETSYFARRDSKKILVNDDVEVRKVTNIGYKMDRMNMSSEDRFKNAREQIDVYFKKEYGEKWNDIVSQMYRIPEYLEVSPNLEQMIQEFPVREGGHRLLMEKLMADTLILNQGGCLVEVGCSREGWAHLNSTYKLALMAERLDADFYSIDVDTDWLNKTKRMVSWKKYQAINQKAEEFLSKFDRQIDYVYLDGFDVSLGANHHSADRKERYRKYLNCEIVNDKAYQHHLDCVKEIDRNLRVGGLICLNGVTDGVSFKDKGVTAIPWLLRSGRYKLLSHRYSAMLLEKTTQRSVGQVGKELVSSPKEKFVVTLLGYTRTKPRHTNWFPWNRFLEVYQTMGYPAEWCELKDLAGRAKMTGLEDDFKPRIFICWNEPTCVELVKSGVVHREDVIIQKLTSLGKGMESVNWGDNPKEYFKDWHWPLYQTVEDLLDRGFNIYAFGCQTTSEGFPEKKRIVEKLEKAGRLFWINWGSTVFTKEEIEGCKPVMDGLENDMAYVGSKWGKAGRGNTDQWDKFIQPVIDGADRPLKCDFHGSGFVGGMISDQESKKVLRGAKICPIIHAPSWVAEEGIQDRFYTVFTAGRFGVCDNPGVYQFFDQDDVVVETDPVKYVEKTKFFMEHPEEQRIYIERVQSKIRTKYNFYVQWDNILTRILHDQRDGVKDDDYQFLSRVSALHGVEGAWAERK